jgi:hypothetical protein
MQREARLHPVIRPGEQLAGRSARQRRKSSAAEESSAPGEALGSGGKRSARVAVEKGQAWSRMQMKLKKGTVVKIGPTVMGGTRNEV